MDKRDTFDFPIVNFPTLNGNIPKKSSCGVFTGELVRYARACTYQEDFKQRTLPLVSKLKKQFFKSILLKSTWIKFCNSHILLIQKYGPKVMFLYDEWMWFWRTKSIDVVTIYWVFGSTYFWVYTLARDDATSHVFLIIDLLSGRGEQAMSCKRDIVCFQRVQSNTDVYFFFSI